MLTTFERLLHDSPILALGAVFLAGALASLSSCTVVRIPIVVGCVAAQNGSKKRLIAMTCLFALGLTVTYAVFGSLLGLTGNVVLRFVQVNKYIFWALGILLFAIGLIVAGLVRLPLRTWRPYRLAGPLHRAGSIGAFVFGALFACIELPACPCCGAVLLVIAGLVVAENLSAYAVLVFVVFALGQSFPILAVGISTSLIKPDLIKYLASKVHGAEQYLRLLAGNVLMVLGVYFLLIA